ncbi:single-strand selective monofunctional uracil DNA glycosylase-like isoform X1 [Cimex lectularius]|uniref:Uracil-DNA glycosylase-like domain-containing protein n=1 Tax=Cimex lectularius TaxID=79782 RepID=A0A8I6R924_CIMLE|nr:single-strand selective monofunctional uracil DNA glycosylase-like isoform X1 [Cimex lectularius]
MADLTLKELILQIELKLATDLVKLDFGPKVEYVYNPLEYAVDVHSRYLDLACSGRKKALFLGMNPGPWGMMQNGVPFGESTSVKEFLKLTGVIHRPDNEHPQRPVLGLDCKRREVSGKRFWSLVELLGDGSPHDFFRNCTVHNYFPLCLLSGKGKNVTPPELKTAVQKEINEMCDQSLVNVISLLDIEIVIAVGRFAEKRAQIIKERFQLPIRVCYISHPSPRNPESNKNWLLSTKDLLLNKYGLLKLFSP